MKVFNQSQSSESEYVESFEQQNKYKFLIYVYDKEFICTYLKNIRTEKYS